MIIHYQDQGVITFIGDLCVTLALSFTYPLISKYFPVLVGGRGKKKSENATAGVKDWYGKNVI